MTAWNEWVDGECASVRGLGRWRAPRPFDAAGPRGRLSGPGDGEAPEVISFASNDYLGLTQHPAVAVAAVAAIERWGTGSGAARLVVGSRPVHHDLEEALAHWKRTERAVLFPTGYAANLGVLTTFGTSGVTILSDELNHASIVDGCRLAAAEVSVYRHRDLDHLEALLRDAERALVVTDSVFSMDGDVADLDGLVELCGRHRALLVLDEAHAVFGPEPAVDEAQVLRVGTLSKALGSLGGFVAGPASFCRLIENRARPYIFTTASSPADSAAALAALDVLRSQEGEDLKRKLRENVEVLAPGHPSPILPVLVGSEERATAASAQLLERGLLVPAIRPPTVPAGTSRLRVALSAAHEPHQVGALAAALGQLDLEVSRAS